MCMIKFIDYESEGMVLAVWNIKSISDCKRMTCRLHMNVSLKCILLLWAHYRKIFVAIFMYGASVILVWLVK